MGGWTRGRSSSAISTADKLAANRPPQPLKPGGHLKPLGVLTVASTSRQRTPGESRGRKATRPRLLRFLGSSSAFLSWQASSGLDSRSGSRDDAPVRTVLHPLRRTAEQRFQVHQSSRVAGMSGLSQEGADCRGLRQLSQDADLPQRSSQVDSGWPFLLSFPVFKDGPPAIEVTPRPLGALLRPADDHYGPAGAVPLHLENPTMHTLALTGAAMMAVALMTACGDEAGPTDEIAPEFTANSTTADHASTSYRSRTLSSARERGDHPLLRDCKWTDKPCEHRGRSPPRLNPR